MTRTDMKISSVELLQAPLTAHEARWASELADKLPDDIDLTFEESKILTRLSIREWPNALILKVQDIIDIEDFLAEDPEESVPDIEATHKLLNKSEGVSQLELST
jgi:hypothetical protein